jgi:hypothetical protein
MKYIKKGRLAAIYQTIAETKNPEPIDLDNATHQVAAAVQLGKKVEAGTVDLAAMRKAIDLYKDRQATEFEQYFSGLIKND